VLINETLCSLTQIWKKTHLTDSLDFKQSVHVIDVLVDEAIKVGYQYLI
jgi:hypothetical protein